MIRDEWTPWVEHDFSGCPFRNGEVVEIRTNEGWTDVARFYNAAKARGWRGPAEPCPLCGAWIVSYRVQKPHGLLQLIEMVENLPDTVRETVAA